MGLETAHMSNRLQYKHGRHTLCRPDREFSEALLEPVVLLEL